MWLHRNRSTHVSAASWGLSGFCRIESKSSQPNRGRNKRPTSPFEKLKRALIASFLLRLTKRKASGGTQPADLKIMRRVGPAHDLKHLPGHAPPILTFQE